MQGVHRCVGRVHLYLKIMGVGDCGWRILVVVNLTYLPSGLDGVEVVAEGAGDDPDLGEAELRRRRHLGRPHVQARLGAVELVPRHVPHRVLPPPPPYKQ